MGTSGKRWSRLDIVEAERLYASGATCQEIAVRYKLTRSYVSFRLRRAGTPMRPTGRPLDTHSFDRAALVRLREAGATWAELAAIFHITRYAARAGYARSPTEGNAGPAAVAVSTV